MREFLGLYRDAARNEEYALLGLILILTPVLLPLLAAAWVLGRVAAVFLRAADDDESSDAPSANPTDKTSGGGNNGIRLEDDSGVVIEGCGDGIRVQDDSELTVQGLPQEDQ